MATKETERDRIKRRFLNNPMIAIVIIISGVVAAIIGQFTGILQLWEKIVPPHDFYYAALISDEYYVRLAAFERKEQAEKLFSKLLLLSKISAKYEKEDPLGQFRSSSIMIGFEPDQIVFARSDSEASEWLVGLDLESGQGGTRTTEGELARIRNRFVNIENEYRGEPQHEFPMAAAEVRRYFDTATVAFFSSVKYRQTHGHAISKNAN